MKKVNFLVMLLTMVTMSVANYAKADVNSTGSNAYEDTTFHQGVERVTMVSRISLQVNETYTLRPTVCPAVDPTSFTWYSNNNYVATVSQSGVVTAHSVGSAVITVWTDNGVKASCRVTVTSSDPDSAGPNWTGTYRVTSTVDREFVSNYDYPSEFSITIKEVNGYYYVTELAGFDLTRSIYEGLRVNVFDDQHAEIDLSFTSDLGYYSMTGCFLECMFMISSQSSFQPYGYDEDKIAMTLNPDGSLVIDDFYIFAFGLITNYDFALDASYHNVEYKKSTSVTSIAADGKQSGMLEVYNMNGMLVYAGNEECMPQLAPGTYVLNRGSSSQKILIR